MLNPYCYCHPGQTPGGSSGVGLAGDAPCLHLGGTGAGMTQQRNDTPGPAAGGDQIQHALKLKDQFPSWLAPAQKVVWKNRQITLASSNFQPWEQFPADLFQSSSVKPAFMVDYQPKGSCHLSSGRGAQCG